MNRELSTAQEDKDFQRVRMRLQSEWLCICRYKFKYYSIVHSSITCFPAHANVYVSISQPHSFNTFLKFGCDFPFGLISVDAGIACVIWFHLRYQCITFIVRTSCAYCPSASAYFRPVAWRLRHILLFFPLIASVRILHLHFICFTYDIFRDRSIWYMARSGPRPGDHSGYSHAPAVPHLRSPSLDCPYHQRVFTCSRHRARCRAYSCEACLNQSWLYCRLVGQWLGKRYCLEVVQMNRR